MDIGDPTAAEQALDDLHVSLDHLIKLVEDRALESLDDTGLVGFLQGFERLRNRLPLIDHQMITEGTTRNLAQNLCQGSMTRVLTSALHISAGEAAGRVRAAETLAERMSMTGEPLEPLRPHLAAKQRSGEASAENADVVIRALAPVTRRGFDPDLIDAGEQLLAQFATQFAPKDLRRLAKQVVDRIDQDGTLPKEEIQQDRRFFRMRPTKDGAYAGEFRLTGELRRETAVPARAIGETADQQHPHRRGEAGRGAWTRVTTGSGCTTRSMTCATGCCARTTPSQIPAAPPPP